MARLYITGDDLTIQDVVEVARDCRRVQLAPEAKQRIKDCRAMVERLLDFDVPVYGVNTGFGALAEVEIPADKLADLQKNLVRSHAAGVGGALSEDIVRAMLLLRINTLAKGHSGVRLSTAQGLVQLLNKDVYPFVPEKGSVGASGDLAPLSHLTLVLMGEGEAFVAGKRVPGKKALQRAGIKPVVLDAKEGLALINGTQMMTAIGCLAVHDAGLLMRSALVAAGASCEALLARSTAFDRRIHALRPHKGQLRVAAYIKQMLHGSHLIDSHTKVQDAYSIRCIPQVLGASLDALNFVRTAIKAEINSVTDNPIIIDNHAISGGNFHGQPVAQALDFLCIALAEVGSIAERRVYRMTDPKHSEGLPTFLSPDGGVNSGIMIHQTTAAALVSENKVLCHPAVVDTIPTSAMQEDHVSMGSISARKARQVIENVESIVAIEFLAALQGLEFRDGTPSKVIGAVHNLVRKTVPKLEVDRVASDDIEKMRALLRSGELLRVAGDISF